MKLKLNFKSVALDGVDLKFDGESGRFKGYASTFNGNDSYGDTILPGAYAKTIVEHGLPKMFWGHNWDIPIGKWLSATEDDKGLLVEGEFTKGNPQAEAVMAAMKHGTVDGLSIGFRLSAGDYEEKKDGGRIIKSVTHLYEISVVNFPADDDARISDVRSEDIAGINTIRDLENLLRDAGGFSKSQATTLVAKARKLFEDRGDPDGDEKAASLILERIKSLEEKL